MNFTLCVLLVYNDNGSVQTLCTYRANAICIYLETPTVCTVKGRF